MTLQDIIQGAGNDISGGYKALAAMLSQPKSRTKTNGAISNNIIPIANTVGKAVGNIQPVDQGVPGSPTISGLLNKANRGKQSTIGDILSGNIQNAPAQAGSDLSSLNKSVAPGNNGVNPTVIGMIGTDEVGASPVKITLKPSVYGAGREAAVQNTVDTIVPGSTATEKYNNLEPTMSNLGDKINLAMAQNPQSAPLDQIMNDYDRNLAAQGVYRTSQSTKKSILSTAQGYITDLTNEASGNNTILNPTEIQDTSLQNIKQRINQDYKSVQKKIDNGTSLTDKDKVIGAARQTVDDTLTTLHPEVKELTTQQSHLYDAAEPLYDARSAELKNANKPANSFLGNLKQGITNHPIAALTTGVGATGGLIGLGYTAFVAASQPKTYNFTSGNVNLPGLNQITDQNGNALNDQNTSNYLQKLQSINDQEKNLQHGLALNLPGAETQYGQLELEKQTLNAQNAKTAPVIGQYLETKNALTGLEQAQQLIKNANPQWFQAYGAIGNQISGIRAALVPGYSSFIQQLNSLKGSGINTDAIAGAASPQAANAAIEQAVKFYQNKLSNTLEANGYQLPTSSGKQLLDTLTKQAANPNANIKTVLTPPPQQQQPQASPTPDQFQQLLNAKYQQGVN